MVPLGTPGYSLMSVPKIVSGRIRFPNGLGATQGYSLTGQCLTRYRVRAPIPTDPSDLRSKLQVVPASYSYLLGGSKSQLYLEGKKPTNLRISRIFNYLNCNIIHYTTIVQQTNNFPIKILKTQFNFPT